MSLSLPGPIRRHPVRSAIGSTVVVLATVATLWQLVSDQPLIPEMLTTLREDPWSVKALVLLIGLGILVVAFWLLLKTIRYVRAIPSDLKRRVHTLEDGVNDERMAQRLLKGQYEQLQAANNEMAHEREGRRDWYAEREEVLAERDALTAEVEALKHPPSNSTPPPLSEEEERSIHRARVMWMESGDAAAHKMQYLGVQVLEELPKITYWTALLRSHVTRIEKTMSEVKAALDGRPVVPLDMVIDRLNAFLQAYGELAYWLARIDVKEVKLAAVEHVRPAFERWQRANRRYMREVRTLAKWPEYQGRLHDMWSDEQTIRFLGLLDDKPD